MMRFLLRVPSFGCQAETYKLAQAVLALPERARGVMVGVIGKTGEKALLLGDEAVVRGAIEGGIGFASTYPGTPASEIGDTFAKVAKQLGIYFEYSANEMVAMEMAGAAAACGVRSIVSMKHVGLNVAADAFMTLGYIGVVGGMLIVIGDDPSCHSSQNEQDTRYYARIAGMPVLEPSTPQEACDMAREGLEISEKLRQPVILRMTTRICHVRGSVTFREPKVGKKPSEGKFEKDTKWVVVPAVAKKQHPVMLQKIEDAEKASYSTGFNKLSGKGGKIGAITSGVASNYLFETLEDMKTDIPVLKLGMTFPLPKKMISEFIQGLDKVIIVEELEPMIEDYVRMIAKDSNPKLEVLGKASGHFPRIYEYDMDVVGAALENALGKKLPSGPAVEPTKMQLPTRPPVLCPGCSHMGTYYAAWMATKGKVVCTTDIGCYTLGLNLPSKMADYLLCMGSSVGTAGAMAKCSGLPTIAFIGDSTFFHGGIHGLVSAVYNNHKFVYVILDNSTTAMTGHQPHPGTGMTGLGEAHEGIKIEKVLEGCGVKKTTVVDPYDIKSTIQAFKESLAYDGLSAIVSRHPCALNETREKKKKGLLATYVVDRSKCKKCAICTDKFACPAISLDKDNIAVVSESLCVGCGMCAQVCASHAIAKKEVSQ